MYKAVQIALDEVGYCEKKTNDDLDSKTGNAGYNNFTKYARDLDALKDFYNTQKQTKTSSVPWCDIFIDWCFWKAYGEDLALKMLCQPKKSAGAGCTQSVAYYRNAGRFFWTPVVGDQIFFTWAGEIEHTGLVYAVDSSKVYTVEGNTSGKTDLVANGGSVCKKEYLRSSSIIYGYGRPDYALAHDESYKDDKDDGGKNCMIQMIYLQKGSVCREVKTLQVMLNYLGFDCGDVDGEFGPLTDGAVRDFQRAVNIGVDGIVGPTSWRRLLRG